MKPRLTRSDSLTQLRSTELRPKYVVQKFAKEVHLPKEGKAAILELLLKLEQGVKYNWVMRKLESYKSVDLSRDLLELAQEAQAAGKLEAARMRYEFLERMELKALASLEKDLKVSTDYKHDLEAWIQEGQDLDQKELGRLKQKKEKTAEKVKILSKKVSRSKAVLDEVSAALAKVRFGLAGDYENKGEQKLAYELYTKVAEAGYKGAILKAGILSMDYAQNPVAAKAWLEQIADEHSVAQRLLGELYFEGYLEDTDLFENARYYLGLADKQGDLEATLLLGCCCVKTKQYAGAKQWFDNVISRTGGAGDLYAEAAWRLGKLYLKKQIPSQRPSMDARLWSTIAIQNGEARANKTLGRLHLKKKEIPEAIKYFEVVATELDDADAQFVLTELYTMLPLPAEEKMDHVSHWGLQAGDNGYPWAYKLVADAYSVLAGAQNRGSAAYYYALASNEGCEEAFHELLGLFCQGRESDLEKLKCMAECFCDEIAQDNNKEAGDYYNKMCQVGKALDLKSLGYSMTIV
tara:strand:- start:103995 stop:105557 length:1563 start_codon:yes stop_codon:yes gene_type:complete